MDLRDPRRFDSGELPQKSLNKMKKIILSILALGSVAFASGCVLVDRGFGSEVTLSIRPNAEPAANGREDLRELRTVIERAIENTGYEAGGVNRWTNGVATVILEYRPLGPPILESDGEKASIQIYSMGRRKDHRNVVDDWRRLVATLHNDLPKYVAVREYRHPTGAHP